MTSPRKQKWSQRVTATSFALELEPGVFTLGDPRAIAASLKRSADSSRRRKTEPFRSAMSMLNFYINRAGRQLPEAQRSRLEKAKIELRVLYGRPRLPTTGSRQKPGAASHRKARPGRAGRPSDRSRGSRGE